MQHSAPPAAPRPMPSRRGYVVAAVILVLSVGTAAALFVWMSRSLTDFEITPLRMGDTITVGEESQTLFAQLPPEADPAADFFCSVTAADGSWEYAPKSGTMNVNNWTRVGVTPEDLPAGEYVVECTGFPRDTPMGVGDSPNIGGNVAKGLTGGLLIFLGVVAALIVTIVTAVRRSAARKPPPPTHPPRPPYGQPSFPTGPGGPRPPTPGPPPPGQWPPAQGHPGQQAPPQQRPPHPPHQPPGSGRPPGP